MARFVLELRQMDLVYWGCLLGFLQFAHVHANCDPYAFIPAYSLIHADTCINTLPQGVY